jgi:hypothetical protein
MPNQFAFLSGRNIHDRFRIEWMRTRARADHEMDGVERRRLPDENDQVVKSGQSEQGIGMLLRNEAK